MNTNHTFKERVATFLQQEYPLRTAHDSFDEEDAAHAIEGFTRSETARLESQLTLLRSENEKLVRERKGFEYMSQHIALTDGVPEEVVAYILRNIHEPSKIIDAIQGDRAVLVEEGKE